LAAEDRQVARTYDKSRGRQETRTLTTITARSIDLDWPGARQLLQLERRFVRQGVETVTISYAITSLDRRRVKAQQLLSWWRGRWDIENRCFWIKDTAQREDHCRVREGRAPFILSLVRNAVINYLRANQVKNLTATLRTNALKVQYLLTKLGILNN
jgi:Transposase DDE domain